MAAHTAPLGVPRLPSIVPIGRPKKSVKRDVGGLLQAFSQALSRRPAAFTAGAPVFDNRAQENATGGNRARVNAEKGNRAKPNAEKGNRAQANALPRTKDEQAKKRTPRRI